ncbi:hypothetical protein CMQ_6838 [Grosmannia clavigera kw1407]|uniref:Uncharacterized protein n=1 Tax=Grosmannia clavigera (strain kw1407 / UAMH 11150) TaxID=655863 RepID=F0X7W3_GROCL|nr:uncharacterized protein CMQ_6838 [Grosmannia clavigera kw1407]EFX06517.1 hypothetical protein CMQ_6838 [Grosmannia clavigera kw1407]
MLLLDNTNVLAVPDVPPPSYEEATGILPPATSPVCPPASDAARAGLVRHEEKPTSPMRLATGRRSQIQPAPGSIPTGRQFPPTFNLYGGNLTNLYTLGEHQQTPLYAVNIRASWGNPGPTVALHNGPSTRAPLLAGVDFSNVTDQMSATLPPPISYRGGLTAVRLEVVYGWSHTYQFVMEVGTDRLNIHNEAFEWRHSSGSAIAALGGAHDGWKLVRMCTATLGPRQPRCAPAFLTSDGREVVAIWSDALMSLTKQLKFSFCGTGLSGLLGERWAVMAVMSALAIWEKELGNQARR